METQHLTFSGSIEAADVERGIITGKILPFNEIGNTSVGKVVFETGSVIIHPTAKIKLLLEHDPKNPIGKAVNIVTNDNAIFASFKVSQTTKGRDSLIEASEELRSGLSVGVTVEAAEPREGILYVKEARLQEVSLVSAAAFKSAMVEKVVATEATPEPQEEEKPTEEQPTQESEASVENATPTPEVETDKVEASRPVVTAVAYTTPRSPIKTREDYLYHSIAAALGNDDSKLWVKAADDTTDNAGLIPTRQMTDIVNPLGTMNRGCIDAISSGTLPDAGMTFEIPKVTQMPSVTEEAEGGAVADVDQNIEFISVSVKKFSGAQTASVELWDRSSPIFINELLRNLEMQYAKATDEFVNDRLTAVGTLNATARANTASDFLGYASSAAAAIYKATKGFARSIVVSPDQWANIMGYNDNGRPIYTAIAPQNAGGALSPQSLTGVVQGLNLYVDSWKNGTDDSTMFVINPESFTWYESPRFRLQTNVTATGQISVLYYGFGALAEKVGAGCNRFNFT